VPTAASARHSSVTCSMPLQCAFGVRWGPAETQVWEKVFGLIVYAAKVRLHPIDATAHDRHLAAQMG
jgi:hypothetical protein